MREKYELVSDLLRGLGASVIGFGVLLILLYLVNAMSLRSTYGGVLLLLFLVLIAIGGASLFLGWALERLSYSPSKES